MKYIKLLLTLCILCTISFSCTKNSRTKTFGGTSTLKIQPNKKIVNITWKEDNLWILVKPMGKNDVAETYIFYEKSSWGIWNGTYILQETKVE